RATWPARECWPEDAHCEASTAPPIIAPPAAEERRLSCLRAPQPAREVARLPSERTSWPKHDLASNRSVADPDDCHPGDLHRPSAQDTGHREPAARTGDRRHREDRAGARP